MKLRKIKVKKIKHAEGVSVGSLAGCMGVVDLEAPLLDVPLGGQFEGEGVDGEAWGCIVEYGADGKPFIVDSYGDVDFSVLSEFSEYLG